MHWKGSHSRTLALAVENLLGHISLDVCLKSPFPLSMIYSMVPAQCSRLHRQGCIAGLPAGCKVSREVRTKKNVSQNYGTQINILSHESAAQFQPEVVQCVRDYFKNE